MVRAHIKRKTRHPGFSLVELLAIIVVLAILAATAVPALARIDSIRHSAARDEIARQLALARSSALATGDPYGVRFDTTAHTIALLRIPKNAAPEPAPDATGQPRQPLLLDAHYPGTQIISYVSGSGVPSSVTVWFGYSAVPETRDSSGNNPVPFTQDAVITVTDGLTITVRRETGAIE
jgi:type II secretory pathway pseudopilin PulG